MADRYPGRKRILSTEELADRLSAMAEDPEGPEAHFGVFWFDSSLPPNLDPLSPAYRDAVLMQFRTITGRPFVGQPRGTAFDPATVQVLAARPWPYSTGDALQVGAILTGVGHAVTRTGARAGHRCLLIGARWGNLTMALVRLGCIVTAVDDDGRYATLLEELSRRSHIEFRIMQYSASNLKDALKGEQFDYVIFHDALCECHDPVATIAVVRDQLLAPGGRLVLVGEPLLEDLPYHWGVNPFGDGLWAAYRQGRLKLIFRPSSLLDMLDRSGFDSQLHVCEATSFGNTLVACRRPMTRSPQIG